MSLYLAWLVVTMVLTGSSVAWAADPVAVLTEVRKGQGEVRVKVGGEEEWKLRVDLAACYRLVALYGWSDLVFTHISARIPGPEHHCEPTTASISDPLARPILGV